MEFTLKDGRINEEVELFFVDSLFKLIHVWYCNRGLTLESVNLKPTFPAELKPANLCAKAQGPGDFFFDELPFHLDAESRGPKIIFLGSSNMKRLHGEVSKILEQDSLHVHCDLMVHAPESQITHFLNQCKIPENSIVVMNVCDNSLLQGMTASTADEIGGPSGKPSAYQKDHQSRWGANHQLEVAPYHSGWFNRFGDHLAAKMRWMAANGHRVILVTPLPRYPVPCCSVPNHFPYNFNYRMFIGEIFRLGVFMSRMTCTRSSLVLTPEDICGRGDWFVQGVTLSRDRVHLSPRGYKLAGDCVRRAIAWTLLNVDYPEDETRGSIPAELPFSTWVREFRNSCGYNSVEAVGVAKRPSSTNAGQRPAKQRR